MAYDNILTLLDNLGYESLADTLDKNYVISADDHVIFDINTIPPHEALRIADWIIHECSIWSITEAIVPGVPVVSTGFCWV